ncbi:hypothetical protein ACEPAI_9483 [Sanghuangporus weigelae]
MASNAESSTMAPLSESQSMEERRLQAGPLPRKRGEIGYRESMDRGNGEVRRDDNSTPLPPRHPADRDPEVPPAAADESEPSSPSAPNAVSPAPGSAPITSINADASSMHKPSKDNSFLSWLGLRMGKKFGGVTLSTICRLTFQLFFLLGTIALWVVVSKVLVVSPSNDTPASATGSAEAPPKSEPVFGSSAMIFLHVSFGIVTLVQLLFLERCIFIVRAQRYAHVHHGASLPMHSRNHEGNGPAGGVTGLSMSLAPWNRPPLPTYAAALAQSGVGTGDVEDNFIAIPPPPAYGNTRGSTLLLAGFMPNNIRGSVARASRISRPISQESRLSRPVSYRSHDEEWEQRCDAERALYLAETLDRLENPARTTTNST